MSRKSNAKSAASGAAAAPSDGARALWGAHFSGGPAEVMALINPSVAFDQRLSAQDIAGSRAHCRMLVAQGIIDRSDGDAILGGLDQIEQEIEDGAFQFDPALEDVHLNIEARLTALIGDAGKRLHTARSRNDQVATDFRLWVRDAIDRIDSDLKAFQEALLAQAETHAATVMPGFTHLQPAQPVTFGHHLLAYVEMAGRDRGRFSDARRRLNECPLGAAALAGTSFPIDRAATAEALGFDAPTANSIDSVSDRDFALEALAAAGVCAVHLSRLAEELVVWSTPGFGFVKLSDAFTTGSSIMPQKRNPDAAELVRGKSGRVIGALNALLLTLKGLPLAYSKDMQEDKEPVFDALDTVSLCVRATTGMIADMQADQARMASMAGAGYAVATDLADWLVRELNVPFREAHNVTGQIVKLAEGKGLELSELELGEMQAIEPRITGALRDVLTVEASVASRTSHGGTAPSQVRAAITRARERFL